jgi:hydroxymethylbilane synthase
LACRNKFAGIKNCTVFIRLHTMRIVIGSRGSALARWQAEWVKDRLAERGAEVEIKIIRTTGDRFESVPLAQSGSKGIFIKEIEDALLTGDIDLAVHSLKDLPTDQPPGLIVAAVPEREDARDVLISRNGDKLADLPAGAVVGTGSLRRQAQLIWARRDLKVAAVRGNVDTRIKKLDRDDFDALMLAAAGLRRLGLDGRITEFLSPATMCPAVGQGALAIEAREDSSSVLNFLEPLDHAATHHAVRAERAMLRHLGGGCQLPIAAHATLNDGSLRLTGVVASPDGSKLIRAEADGHFADPESLGARVAEDLKMQGAMALLVS